MEWTPPCHGGDRGFESHQDRQKRLKERSTSSGWGAVPTNLVSLTSEEIQVTVSVDRTRLTPPTQEGDA